LRGRARPARIAAPSRLILLLLFLLAAGAVRADAQCLDCHGDAELLVDVLPEGVPAESLLVDEERYDRSVHGGLDCIDCHADNEEFPHPADALEASCADCHAMQDEILAESVHGRSNGDERLPVSCGTCHGVHDVLPAEDREARLNPLNIYKVCGQCHFSIDPATASLDELMREPYTDDSHARGILRQGLTVSATCASCHGGHDIHRQGDPDSPVSRQNVERTCAKCHVGVYEQYRESVHFLKSVGPEHHGATCSDCHRPHEITHADDDFRIQSIQSCSHCHEQRSGSFRKSYHGKVTRLGFE
jgi:hypothetical protein